MRLAPLVVVFGLLVAAPAAAQEAAAPIDVAEVSGPLDSIAIDFLMDTIEDSDAQVVIIQLDSPGAVSEDIYELLDLVTSPPVPVVVWAGPDPAVAQGGAGSLLTVAGVGAAAPGVKVGYLHPLVAGDSPVPTVLEDGGPLALADRYEVTAPDDIIDLVGPSLGQLVTALDGVEIAYRGGLAVLDTAETTTDDDGNEVLVPTAQIQ